MVTKTDTVRWGPTEDVERDGASDAGLVLLYSPDFESLPTAVVLSDDGVVIGRAPPPGNLCIRHGAVSTLHARILRRGSGWAVKDMGSRNGTVLNCRLQTEAVLEPKDELRFGDAIFKFVPDHASDYLPFRIDGAGPDPDPSILGGYQVRAALREVAAVATTRLSVIVSGETGTGKELFARAVHHLSGRRGQLVAINCAAIPANLLESELFGFKRGAFTGADRDKQGLVRTADGGTLFLDEIGDMPFDAQAKLLRVIETREVLPIGATASEPVDVRFVCASHWDLHALVEAGRFRGDLLARLHGAMVTLPPLRERKEDLYVLVRHFLKLAGAADAQLGMSFMAGLIGWSWPHNVRELDATIRRAVAIAKGATLSVKHLPDAVRENMRDYGTPAAPPRPPQRQGPTAEELRTLLDRHNGNVAAVARELQRDRAQIRRWMRYAGIDPETHRG